MLTPTTDVSPGLVCEAGLLDALVEAVNTVGSHGEALFEFREESLRVAVVDAAQVQLVEQVVDADAFDHYVFDGVEVGFDTARLADLLAIADDDATVVLDWDAETRSVEVRFADVAYELAGIAPEHVSGQLRDLSGLAEPREEVVVDLPTDAFARAVDVVGMAADHARFVMGGPDGTFRVEGGGDTDTATVTVDAHDTFAWRTDPPDPAAETLQSNAYLGHLPGLLDEAVVTLSAGDDYPVFVETTRHDGAIDTTIAQAPRRRL